MNKCWLQLQAIACILIVFIAGCQETPDPDRSTLSELKEWSGDDLDISSLLSPPIQESQSECPPANHVPLESGKHDIQKVINSAKDGDIFTVHGHFDSDLTIGKSITLIGIDSSGKCATLNTKESLPAFRSIHIKAEAAESRVSGLHVQEGGFHVEGNATLRHIHVENGDTCIRLEAKATLSGFIAENCAVGVTVDAQSSLVNGIITHNKGNGIVVNATSKIQHLTISQNEGDGIVLKEGKSQFFNSLITGNRGYGLFEHERAGLLEHLSFSQNRKGQYGGTDVRESAPPIEWERDRFIAITMTQGDRHGTEPALATTAIIRAELSKSPPWKKRKKRKERLSTIAQYTPTKGLQSARGGYGGPNIDLTGEVRSNNTTVGAIEGQREPAQPPTQWFVSSRANKNGEGTLIAPFRKIQDAVNQASPGDIINVVTGLYEESVLIQETHLVLRGVKQVGQTLVPIESAKDPAIPIINPEKTGTHEQAVFLQDTLYGMRIEGLSIENALTGLTVIGRIDDIPPEPVIQHVRFKNNQKGMDADCGGGLLSHNLFVGNTVSTTFRAGNHWKVIKNTFEGPGAGIVFSMLITHGYLGFEVSENAFINAGIYVDALHGRSESALKITENTLLNSNLVVRHGSPTARLVLDNNKMEGTSHLSLPTTKEERPDCEGCLSLRPCKGFCNEKKKVIPKKILPREKVQAHSSPIAITSNGDKVVAVGADFQGVLIRETAPGGHSKYVETGKDPRGVAIHPSNNLALVTNLAAGTLSMVHLEEARELWEIPVGLEPYGVVFSPNATEAWITLSGESAIAIINLENQSIVTKVPVSRKPRGLSLDYRNGKWRGIITHFTPRHLKNKTPGTLESIQAITTIMEESGDEEWITREILLPPIGSIHFPEAVPTLMQSVVVRGNRAYFASFGATPERPKDAIFEGRKLLEFETSVQALLTVLDLDTETIIPEESANLNAPGRILNGPYGIAFSPISHSEVLLPIYGNNSIARFHLHEGMKPKPVRAYRGSVDVFVGTNPRGVVYHPDGDRAYTVNFASGDLSTIDLTQSQMKSKDPLGPPEQDRLSPLARRGKELFYTTQRVDTVADFWFTCGTCHPDGRTDGVTWRFSNGPRSTPIVTSSLDTLPLHFDGDRDEFSDFEHTVRDLQGGFSLDRAQLKPALGERSSVNLAYGWKAMEAYMREGIDTPAAPQYDRKELEKGESLFTQLKCDTCHGGEWFAPEPLGKNPTIANGQVTDTLADVGTKTKADKLGTGGFDPPSLWGVYQTAPYLHDGSALTLREVLQNEKHLYAGLDDRGDSKLTDEEVSDLVKYLTTITDGTPIP